VLATVLPHSAACMFMRQQQVQMHTCDRTSAAVTCPQHKHTLLSVSKKSDLRTCTRWSLMCGPTSSTTTITSCEAPAGWGGGVRMGLIKQATQLRAIPQTDRCMMSCFWLSQAS
jgi:hypothetical protein